MSTFSQKQNAGLAATQNNNNNKYVVGDGRQKARRVDSDSATPIISPATFGVTPALSKLGLECRQFRMGPRDRSLPLPPSLNISFGLACFPRWNYYHGPLFPCCWMYCVIDNCHTHTTTKCGCNSLRSVDYWIYCILYIHTHTHTYEFILIDEFICCTWTPFVEMGWWSS